MDDSSVNRDENGAAHFDERAENSNGHSNIKGFSDPTHPNNDYGDDKNLPDPAEQGVPIMDVLEDQIQSLRCHICENLDLLREIKHGLESLKMVTQISAYDKLEDQATEQQPTMSSKHLKELGGHLQQCRDNQRRLEYAEERNQELGGRSFDVNIENIDQATEQPTTSSSHLKRRRSIEFSNKELPTIDYNPYEIIDSKQSVVYTFDESDIESDMELIRVIMPMPCDSPESDRRSCNNVLITMEKVVEKIVLREEALNQAIESDKNFRDLNVSNAEMRKFLKAFEYLNESCDIDDIAQNEAENSSSQFTDLNDVSTEEESGSYIFEDLEAMAIGGLSDKETSKEPEDANVKRQRALDENADIETITRLLKNANISIGRHNDATIPEVDKLDGSSNKLRYEVLDKRSVTPILKKNTIPPMRRALLEPPQLKDIVFLLKRYTDDSQLNSEDTRTKFKRLRKTRRKK